MIICYSNPAKSLEIARSRLTPEQWNKFEEDFDHFCAYSGFPMPMGKSISAPEELVQYEWAKWAYFQGRGDGEYVANRAADKRIADAKYTRLALAIMDDEQAEQSLERWMGRGE